MKLVITAHVSPVEGDNKIKIATLIIIKVGGRVVATLRAGGRYSPEQAIKEFKRSPERFRACPGEKERLSIYAQAC